MPDLARNREILRKRLVRLIRDNRRVDGPELAQVILPQLKNLGLLILFGGAVRDVARTGGDQFRSDLDFVVYDCRREAFLSLMQELGGRPNRFGGYRLKFPRWKIDIWALEDTWAHTAGLVRVETPADLLKCTFFDWDAVLFDLQTEEIISKPNYLETLSANMLDVNLEENPNPRGSLLRALRRGALWKVRYGPKLTNFVRRQINNESWDTLVALDEAAFSRPVLRDCDPKQIIEGLYREVHYANKIATEPFGPPNEQLELAL